MQNTSSKSVICSSSHFSVQWFQKKFCENMVTFRILSTTDQSSSAKINYDYDRIPPLTQLRFFYLETPVEHTELRAPFHRALIFRGNFTYIAKF